MTVGIDPKVLGEGVFEEAAGVLEMIQQTPEDRQFYEAGCDTWKAKRLA